MNPGPTMYNPNYNVHKLKLGNMITSKSQRRIKEEVRPDAGMYQQLLPFGSNAPKARIVGKKDGLLNARNPSPLQYDPSYKLVKPRAPGAVIK